jgi:glycerophosphoryl diester phosphodiesterase
MILAKNCNAVLLVTAIAVNSWMTAACGQSQQTVSSATQESVQTPIVIAHRGASGYLPEHTLEAAVLAHAMGADYIEQDVVLSKDGKAVVLHDVILDAVTNVARAHPDRVAADGHYYAADFTLEELQRLQVTERSGFRRRDETTRFPADVGHFRIATLDAHLTLIEGMNKSRRRRVGVYVEVKKPAWHLERGLDPSKEVLRVLQQHGYHDSSDRVFLQCFEFDELRRLRVQLDCRLPLIQLLSKTPTTSQLNDYAGIADGVGVAISCVVTGMDDQKPKTTEFVEQCHRQSLVVHVWTVRTDDLPEWCETTNQLMDILIRECGVDGVFCDQPDVAVVWRSEAINAGPLTGPFHLLNKRPAAPNPTGVSSPGRQK